MAAYAALLSLTYIIKQIELHPYPPISLDKTLAESLTANITFLQEFLECDSHSHRVTYRREADPFEMRIADAAHAAEDVIESHIVDRILPQFAALAASTGRADEGFSSAEEIDSEKEINFDFSEKTSSIELYESLQRVIAEMETLKNLAMEIKEKRGNTQPQLQRAASSFGHSSKMHNDIVIGFDDVLIEVLDKLTGGQPDRHVIPIIGMGGIGKTTLARSIYRNQIVTQHFDILVWATISQEYCLKEILLELIQEGRGGFSHMDESELGCQIHKRLSGRRYLIIMDDIWDIEPWDHLRRFFPDNKNGSRIVITTRISNFDSNESYVLKMGFLDEDKSWILFTKNVFGEECIPLELMEFGKKIVENCRGLPLSIVVVGGLLAKSEQTREYWAYIAENLSSVVNLEDNENCLKILHMSYNKLPVYLKPCFLYMGVFSKDRKIPVSKVVKLWVAEGFLKPIDGISSEEVAVKYLKELINRNLVLVHKFGCTGSVKFCNVHDLVRDLSLREAEKERFYSFTRKQNLNIPHGTRRIVIPENTSLERAAHALQSMPLARSLLCDVDIEGVVPSDNLRLLRIMLSSRCDNNFFLENMFVLVNSRYLAVSVHLYSRFPSSVSFLWNLHTLIVDNFVEETAPVEIWNMPLLRHFEFFEGIRLPDPFGQDDFVLGNLQMLGRIKDFRCSDEVVKRIPNIKKLKLNCNYDRIEEVCLNNICHLLKLKSLDWKSGPRAGDSLRRVLFPYSLEKLTLEANQRDCWEDMLEKIGSLPLLQKLVLKYGCFKGGKWDTVEGRFLNLKVLRMEQCTHLEYWTMEGSHFPRLEHLFLRGLVNLVEIPLEMGEIATLQSIELVICSNSAVISAKKIQVEQEEYYGEVSVQVRVWGRDYVVDEEMQGLASHNFKII